MLSCFLTIEERAYNNDINEGRTYFLEQQCSPAAALEQDVVQGLGDMYYMLRLIWKGWMRSRPFIYNTLPSESMEVLYQSMQILSFSI
jgi:hypothetical protein